MDPVETRACFLFWFYRTSPACGSVVVERSSSFSVQLWALSDEQTELLWPSKIPEQPPPFVHPDQFPINQLSLWRPRCSLHVCVGRLSQPWAGFRDQPGMESMPSSSPPRLLLISTACSRRAGMAAVPVPRSAGKASSKKQTAKTSVNS